MALLNCPTLDPRARIFTRPCSMLRRPAVVGTSSAAGEIGKERVSARSGLGG